jgi:hypothetical protein
MNFGLAFAGKYLRDFCGMGDALCSITKPLELLLHREAGGEIKKNPGCRRRRCLVICRTVELAGRGVWA